jgi:hypothetical protein
MFTGTVVIASSTLDASVFLQGGTPAVVAVEAIPSISISAIYNHFFSLTSLGAWPSDIVDVALTDSSVFYSFLTAPPFPANLPAPIAAALAAISGKGLYVTTTVTVTLADTALSALASIAMLPGQGVRIEADLTQPISLLNPDFLSLAGPTGAGGPKLVVQTFNETAAAMNRGFTVSGTPSLFGNTFGDVSLGVSEDPASDTPQLSATISYDGTIEPFTDPALGFTWSKAAGFLLTNFPRIPIPNVAIDASKFMTLLKQVGSSECGDFGDLVFKTLFQTDFVAHPTVSTTKPAGSAAPDGQQIYVSVAGYYVISIAGNVVVTVDLPVLVLSAATPAMFSFSSIVSDIATTIGSNAESVVQQLWNNKAKLALFMAVIVGKEAMQEAVDAMTCELKDELEDFLEELVEAAIDAALDEALEDIAAAMAALTALDWLADLFGDNSDGALAALPVPTITSQATYAADAVSFGWSAVAGATGYRVELVSPVSGFVGPVQALGAGAVTATFPFGTASLAAGTYTAQVTAVATPTSGLTPSMAATSMIAKLATPAAVTGSLSVPGGTATVQWNAVAGATSYIVTLDAGGGHTTSGTVTVAGAAPPTLSLPTAALGAGGASFTASVVAHAAAAGSAAESAIPSDAATVVVGTPAPPPVPPPAPAGSGIGFDVIGTTFKVH